jgi:hypothetical protein
LWEQGAEENRTQPIVMRLTGHEREGCFRAKKSRLGVITSGSFAWSFIAPLPGRCSCEVC